MCGAVKATLMWRPEKMLSPTKNAISTAGSIRPRVTPPNTIAFAHSTGSRFGTAVNDARIIPVEYSAVMIRTPSTPIASCAS